MNGRQWQCRDLLDGGREELDAAVLVDPQEADGTPERSHRQRRPSPALTHQEGNVSDPGGDTYDLSWHLLFSGPSSRIPSAIQSSLYVHPLHILSRDLMTQYQKQHG